MKLKNSSYKVLTILLISILGIISYGYNFLNKEIKKSYALSDITDVTSKVIFLGKPFTKDNYSNNVWDMQVFDGKIYLGHGQWEHQNVGPINLYTIDPKTDQITTNYTVFEESIEKFKVLDGKLYIPGVDTLDSWEYGNFYVLEKGGSWIKHRTIPNALHVFDMAYYNNKLYAVIGTEPSTPSYGTMEIQESSDGGLTWTSRMHTDEIFSTCKNRCLSLFELGGKLYASQHVTTYASGLKGYIPIVEVGDQTSTIVRADEKFTYYDIPTSSVMHRIERQGYFKDKTLFIYFGSLIDKPDYYYPKSMFVATKLSESSKLVTFPETNALAIDILYREEKVYVLTHIKKSSTSYTNIIYESSDLNTWEELFRFDRDTFARSFEETNGNFYFGLGSLEDDVKASTGQILKVAKEFYAKDEGEEITVSTPYTMSGSYIQIEEGISLSTFLSNIIVETGVSKKVYDLEGDTQITTGSLGSGMKLEITKDSSAVNYTVVVKGDTNGDGNVSSADALIVRRHAVGISLLPDYFVKAGDIDNNDTLGSADALIIRRYIVGLGDL